MKDSLTDDLRRILKDKKAVMFYANGVFVIESSEKRVYGTTLREVAHAAKFRLSAEKEKLIEHQLMERYMRREHRKNTQA